MQQENTFAFLSCSPAVGLIFNDMCKDELDVGEDRLDDMCDDGLVSLRFLNTTSESSFDSPPSVTLYESFTLFSGAEVESSCFDEGTISFPKDVGVIL